MAHISRYSPAVEAAFPRMGICAFCGVDDQRHRVIDAIAERYRAGDSAEEIAEDYGIEPELVPIIASEPATRAIRTSRFSSRLPLGLKLHAGHRLLAIWAGNYAIVLGWDRDAYFPNGSNWCSGIHRMRDEDLDV